MHGRCGGNHIEDIADETRDDDEKRLIWLG